jgi:hypothetical protein
VWDSAAFSSIFLASSFSCSQALSTPAHTQVTQTVSPPMAQTGNQDLFVRIRGGPNGYEIPKISNTCLSKGGIPYSQIFCAYGGKAKSQLKQLSNNLVVSL